MLPSSLTINLAALLGVFFSTGLTIFPEELLGMYKSAVFSSFESTPKSILMSLLFTFGTCWGIFATINLIANRLNQGKVTSAVHFYNAVFFGFFALRDYQNRNVYQKIMELEDLNGIYGNIAIFGVFGALNLINWVQKGSKFPNVMSLFGNMNNAGEWGLRLFCLVFGLLGYLCVFQPDTILKSYNVKGVASSPAMMMMMTNMGWGFIFSAVGIVLVRTAQSEKARYALNRYIWVISTAFFFMNCIRKLHFERQGVAAQRNPGLNVNIGLFLVLSLINGMAMRAEDVKKAN